MSRADYGRGRQYSAAEKAEAVGLATAIGPKRAGEQLGMPGRTIAYWMHQPANSAAIAVVEANIADRLRAAHELALQAVIDGLHDPKARLSDRAAALRTLGEQLALAEGRATANIQSVNVNIDPLAALSPDEQIALRTEIDAWQATHDNADAVSVALDDPFNLSNAQITGLIAAIEAKIGHD